MQYGAKFINPSSYLELEPVWVNKFNKIKTKNLIHSPVVDFFIAT